MNCRRFEDLLDDFVDGELEAESRQQAQRHLDGCASCREAARQTRSVVDAAAALPRSTPPSRDLFPEIHETIGRSRRPAPASGARWMRLAAAFLILAVAGWLVVRMRGETSPGRVAAKPAASAVTAAMPASGAIETLDVAVRQYAAAAEQLLAEIDARPERLSPATRKVLQQNLVIIDEAIDQMRAALEADPESPGTALALAAMHEQKVQFLRRVSRLSS